MRCGKEGYRIGIMWEGNGGVKKGGVKEWGNSWYCVERKEVRWVDR